MQGKKSTHSADLNLAPSKDQALGILRQTKTKFLPPRDSQSSHSVESEGQGIERGLGWRETQVGAIKMEMTSKDATSVRGC